MRRTRKNHANTNYTKGTDEKLLSKGKRKEKNPKSKKPIQINLKIICIGPLIQILRKLSLTLQNVNEADCFVVWSGPPIHHCDNVVRSTLTV